MEEHQQDKYIQIKDVTKIYKIKNYNNYVLKNINLRIDYGDKIGILGANGSGKSTFIQLLSKIIKPDFGSIDNNGMKVSWPLAFQGGFQGSLTGMDNLKFIGRVYGIKWQDKIEFVKDFTELGRYFNEPVKLYSSGMRARLAFAISLVVDFDCYLIDEILAVGDSRFHKKCHDELFVKRKDKTFIIVSHQANIIEKYTQKYFVLKNGNLIKCDKFKQAWELYTINIPMPT